MFKRLLSGASVHTIAIPVAISILASVGFKALQIHGTWTLEYIDVSLAFVALGVLAGLVVMALNFDERLGELSRNIRYSEENEGQRAQRQYSRCYFTDRSDLPRDFNGRKEVGPRWAGREAFAATCYSFPRPRLQ